MLSERSTNKTISTVTAESDRSGQPAVDVELLKQFLRDVDRLRPSKVTELKNRLVNNPRTTAIGAVSLLFGGGDLVDKWPAIQSKLSSFVSTADGSGSLLTAVLFILYAVDRFLARD